MKKKISLFIIMLTIFFSSSIQASIYASVNNNVLVLEEEPEQLEQRALFDSYIEEAEQLEQTPIFDSYIEDEVSLPDEVNLPDEIKELILPSGDKESGKKLGDIFNIKKMGLFYILLIILSTTYSVIKTLLKNKRKWK